MWQSISNLSSFVENLESQIDNAMGINDSSNVSTSTSSSNDENARQKGDGVTSDDSAIDATRADENGEGSEVSTSPMIPKVPTRVENETEQIKSDEHVSEEKSTLRSPEATVVDEETADESGADRGTTSEKKTTTKKATETKEKPATISAVPMDNTTSTMPESGERKDAPRSSRSGSDDMAERYVDEIIKARKALKKRHELVEKLKEKLREVVKQRNGLAKKLDTLKNITKKLKVRLDDAKESETGWMQKAKMEAEERKRAVLALESRANQAEATSRETMVRLERVEKRSEELARLLAEERERDGSGEDTLNERIAELEKQAVTLNDQLRSEREKIARDRETMEQKAAAFETRSKDLEEELRVVRDSNRSRSRSSDEATAKLAEAERRIKELEEQTISSPHDIRQNSPIDEDTVMKLANAERRTKELEELLRTERERNQLSSKVVDDGDEENDASSKLAAVERRAKELETQLASEREKHVKELNELRADHASTRDDTSSKLAELRSKHEDATTLTETLRRKIEVREKQLAAKSEQYGKMHRELCDLRDHAETTRAKLKIAQEETKQATEHRKQAEVLSASVRRLEDEAKRAKEKQKSLVDKLKTARDTHKASLLEMERLRQASVTANDLSKKDQDEMSAKLVDAESRVKRAEDELRIAREREERAAQQRNDAESAEVENLRRELKTMKRKLKEMKDQSEEDIRSQRERVNDMTRKWRDAEDRCRRATTLAADATRPLLADIKTLQTEKEDALQEASESRRALRERLEEAERATKSAIERATRSSNAMNVAEERVRHLEETNVDLRKKLADATSELATASTLTEDHRVLREVVAGLRETIDRNTAIADKKESRLRSEIATLTELKNRAEATVTRLMTSQQETERQQKQAHNTSFGKEDERDGKVDISEEKPRDESSQSTVEASSIRPRGSSFVQLAAANQQIKVYRTRTDALQRHIKDLEKARDSLSEELVSMSEKCRGTEMKLKRASAIAHKYKSMRRKHDVLLELLGEKEEELDRLRTERREI